MSRRYIKPQPQIKTKGIHVNTYCNKCAVFNIKELAHFGDKDDNFCGDHWTLTAHYQELKYKIFYEALSKDDLK